MRSLSSLCCLAAATTAMALLVPSNVEGYSTTSSFHRRGLSAVMASSATKSTTLRNVADSNMHDDFSLENNTNEKQPPMTEPQKPKTTTAYTTRRTALQQLVASTVFSTISSTALPLAASASSSSTAAAVVATVGSSLTTPPNSRMTTWPLGKVAFSLLPLAGSYTRRATVMETVVDPDNKSFVTTTAKKGARRKQSGVKDAVDDVSGGEGSGIWTFDQIQGVVNVNVPVRMTVIKVRP